MMYILHNCLHNNCIVEKMLERTVYKTTIQFSCSQQETVTIQQNKKWIYWNEKQASSWNHKRFHLVRSEKETMILWGLKKLISWIDNKGTYYFCIQNFSNFTDIYFEVFLRCQFTYVTGICLQLLLIILLLFCWALCYHTDNLFSYCIFLSKQLWHYENAKANIHKKGWIGWEWSKIFWGKTLFQKILDLTKDPRWCHQWERQWLRLTG